MFSKAKSNADEGKKMANQGHDDQNGQMTRRAASGKSNGRSMGRAAGVPSIISSDMVINGTIESAGEIQFDGEIDGNIIAKGLVVGEAAKVVGEIVAEKVRVSGTVEGAIKGVNVELASTANVTGDIVHSSLSIENGARFDGNCRHSDDPTGSAKATPKPRPIPAPQRTDAAAAPVARAPQPIPAHDTAIDAEIEMPADSVRRPAPQPEARELMPARAEPAPDRNFVLPKATPDLR